MFVNPFFWLGVVLGAVVGIFGFCAICIVIGGNR